VVKSERTIHFDMRNGDALVCRAGDFDWLKRLKLWTRVMVALRLIFERKMYTDEQLND